jgi:long-chain acyl-CoA synthetase
MSDSQITYRSVDLPKEHHIRMLQNNIDTLEKVFSYVVKIHTTKRCVGTREILGEEDEVQSNGRVFKKYKMGEYKWLSFFEAEQQARHFGRGIRELGVQPRDKVVLFAETRAEWMISAHGLFKQSCTIVTIYATLGEEGITHGVNETEVDTIITTHELLPKLRNILKTIPKIKRIVFFEDQLFKTDTSGFGDITITPYKEVVKKGETSKFGMLGTFDLDLNFHRNSFISEDSSPSRDDVAIIMYTSGSTGTPKGVLLTHFNCIATMKNFCDVVSSHQHVRS